MKNTKTDKVIKDNKYEDKQKWISEIKRLVEEKKCKALLLSGASAAGKTFMSEEVAKVLTDECKKVFIFSTDNFYKGITRNILDKAEKNFYNGHIENKAEIIDIVRNHTIDLQFQEKYDSNSCKGLKEKLKGIAPDDLVDNLKTEFEEQKVLVSSEAFDIFGNINEDNTKIKYIGSKSHRENEKNKYKILNINKKIDVIDFTEKIQEIVNYLNEALIKITALYDMPIYKLLPINEHLRDKSFDVYNIDIEKELEECTNYQEGAYNLMKLNIKEGMPLLYFSNIIL